MDQRALRERVLPLLPAIRERAAETENERSVPERTIRELQETSILRACVPVRYGGSEAWVLDVLDAVIELGKACASTAWVTSLFATHSVIVGWFPEPAQDAVWADGPDTLVASSIAPVGTAERVAGGVMLSGRWSFSSGVDHASWLLLGARWTAGWSLFLVPRSAVTIEDDWHVSGLRGTGSKSVSAAGTVVPDDRILAMIAIDRGRAPGLQVNRSALFRVPFQPLFFSTFVAPAIGVGFAAADHFAAYTAGRVDAYTGADRREDPFACAAIARATAELAAARQLLSSDWHALHRAVTSGGGVSAELNARAMYNPSFAVSLCRTAVDRLFALGGAKSLMDANPLQRLFRDMGAIAQHPAVSEASRGFDYGKWLVAQHVKT